MPTVETILVNIAHFTTSRLQSQKGHWQALPAVETRQGRTFGRARQNILENSGAIFPKPRRKALIMFGSRGSVGTATRRQGDCSEVSGFAQTPHWKRANVMYSQAMLCS
jgi:hypothetical protein